MARTATPWYWEERNGWYVNIRGQRQHLGDHPENAPIPRKLKGRWNAPETVLQKFHELMAQLPAAEVKRPATDAPLVADILDKYLDWCQKNRAPRTYEWYRDHIQSFLNSLTGAATLTVAELKPFHVIEWVGAHADWSRLPAPGSPAHRTAARSPRCRMHHHPEGRSQGKTPGAYHHAARAGI